MGWRVAAGGEATEASKSRELNSEYHLAFSIYLDKSGGLRFEVRAGGVWYAIAEPIRCTTTCTSVVS